MTSKLKLHLLAHLQADILRFGPLVGVATEVFECFNAIFRYCSILSNHLAPSRDIAFQLASQELLKHRLTGGWWPTVDGEWQRPGQSVRNFIHANPTLQALVGWTSTEPFINGESSFIIVTPGLIIIPRFFQTGTAQTRCQSEGGKPNVHSLVLDARSQRSQFYFRRCQFTVDTVPVCGCTVWRQLFHRIMDFCKIALACQFTHHVYIHICNPLLGRRNNYRSHHRNFGRRYR